VTKDLSFKPCGLNVDKIDTIATVLSQLKKILMIGLSDVTGKGEALATVADVLSTQGDTAS
jgi:hypothetical protein